MPVSKQAIVDFLRLHRYGVAATQGANGTPEAALVGYIVSDRLEIFFDSFENTRKIANLRHNPRLAFVAGGMTVGDERTVQLDGVVEYPGGEELERLKEAYFADLPDGRRRSKLPGIMYLRIRPLWVRYTDFNVVPPVLTEFHSAQLAP
jgi:general stress protein 26